MKRVMSAVLAAATLSGAPVALATENCQANFPQGRSGAEIGNFPPFPGLFVLQQSNFVTANGLYDNNGNKNPYVSYKLNGYVNVDRILLSYPIKLPYDGHVYSQLTLPYTDLRQEVNGFKSNVGALANIAFSPVIQTFKFGYLTEVGGLDIVTDGGNYNPNAFSASSGYWTWCPNLGFRYDTRTGIDLGILSRFEISQKDPHTSYQSGTLNESDFLAMWNVSPVLKLGMVGNFLVQFTDDHQASGVPLVGGNREVTLAFGPSISYSAHIGTYHFNVDANAQVDVLARNTTKPTNFWINLGIPLFASVPHYPIHAT